MTSFVNVAPQSVFADLLTTTNSGQGLSSTLQNVQDAIGNNSTIQIALNAVNFNTSGGNTFQLQGVALTATATQINEVCGSAPIFSGSVPVTLNKISADPVSGSAGMIYYNTTLNQFRGYITGTGWVSLNHTP
jgi:hypothetical protein